jgi:ATP-binding cassette subfamily F protein 1
MVLFIGDDDDDDNNYDDDNDDRKAEAEKQLSELSKLVDRLQAVGAELDAIGAYGGEAKVRRILTGLGFTDGMQNNSSMTLSGGWRVRVSLAKALFMEPRLLLLDEPTNHLDLDAVLWLDEYLSVHWKGTILIVSHDADFLDSVCTDILHIDEAKLNAYSGNITSFEKMRGQIEAKKQREWKLQQKTLKEFHTQGMNAEKAAKRTMEKLELSSLIMEQPREYRVKFNFKSAEDDMPSISFLDVGFSYGVSGATTASASTSASAAGGGGKKLPPLFDGLRFSIGSSSRIAIVGPNGTGKTTLLKLMTKRLEPTSGEVSHHQKLRIGIYDQHFEELLPLNLTSIAYLTSQYDVTDLEARKYLGMFGLDGARHLIRIGELSGGQKARVVFAALALKRPHILILDEPTNHLDLESVEALIEALKEFQGGIVLVSHDARLITATESEIWVCEGSI